MKKDHYIGNFDLENLVGDKAAYNKFIYTPLLEAVGELRRRWGDNELEKIVDEYLGGGIPEPLLNGFGAVLGRQLCTPSYELRHFMNILDGILDGFDINPVFWEYYDDKFTSRNPQKYALGKVKGQKNIGKKGGVRIESKTVIHFNKSEGKKIREIETVWGQPLIDFHHELLEKDFPGSSQYFFDASEWFHKTGRGAKEYYFKYIALFVRHGIWFENMLFNDDELMFAKEVFLPAFFDVWEKTGKKPIIVALLPTDAENEPYWDFYPFEILSYIEGKIG